MGTKSGWRWWLYSHFSPFELFFLTHRLPSLATREPSCDTIGALILSGQQGRMECVSSNPVTLLIPQSPGSHQQIFHWCCVIQLSCSQKTSTASPFTVKSFINIWQIWFNLMQTLSETCLEFAYNCVSAHSGGEEMIFEQVWASIPSQKSNKWGLVNQSKHTAWRKSTDD